MPFAGVAPGVTTSSSVAGAKPVRRSQSRRSRGCSRVQNSFGL